MKQTHVRFNMYLQHSTTVHQRPDTSLMRKCYVQFNAQMHCSIKWGFTPSMTCGALCISCLVLPSQLPRYKGKENNDSVATAENTNIIASVPTGPETARQEHVQTTASCMAMTFAEHVKNKYSIFISLQELFAENFFPARTTTCSQVVHLCSGAVRSNTSPRACT